MRKQIECGVDVINDGEVAKPSYATYPKDRLSGFGGVAEGFFGIGDLADYPEWGEKVLGDSPLSTLKRPACNAAVKYQDRSGLESEIANLKAAAGQVNPADVFMSAASPGVISIFCPINITKVMKHIWRRSPTR